jgi:hypothetical protein
MNRRPLAESAKLQLVRCRTMKRGTLTWTTTDRPPLTTKYPDSEYRSGQESARTCRTQQPLSRWEGRGGAGCRTDQSQRSKRWTTIEARVRALVDQGETSYRFTEHARDLRMVTRGIPLRTVRSVLTHGAVTNGALVGQEVRYRVTFTPPGDTEPVHEEGATR